MIKIFSVLLLFTFAVNNSLEAQKVKRRGADPLMRGPKPGTQMPLYTLDQLVGKWQEVARTNRKNGIVYISDTAYLTFTGDGDVETKDGNKSTMRGSAQIDLDNILIVASDVYTIKSLTETELLLDDDEKYIHKFTKVEKFSFEDFGKDSVVKEEFTKTISVSLSDIMGKWMVYKREAKPGSITPPVNIITYLRITEITGDSTAKGSVVFYETPEGSTELPCDIQLNDGNIEVTSGNTYFWRLFIYKADKKEFVFGSSEVLLYFAKPY